MGCRSNPTDPFAKGVEALSRGHFFLARTCFRQAAEEDGSPLVMSYLGLSMALASAPNFDEAVTLCRNALTCDPVHTALYLNLGKVLILAGRRDEAVEVLRKGAAVGCIEEFAAELERLGIRRPPVFTRLPRRHPLNKYTGLLLARLGLR